MNQKQLTPLKAIRKYCLMDCMEGEYNFKKVKNCENKKCHLYPFRFGKNSFLSEKYRKKLKFLDYRFETQE